MVDYQLKKISIKDIDINNCLFRITNDMDIDEICDSIAAFGLISPPILKNEKLNYTIISGFKRITSCKRLGYDSVNCLIIEAEDLSLCHKIAILDNSNNRKLTFLEIVNCIHNIKQYYTDNKALSYELSKLLHIENGNELISKFLKIINLPKEILDLIDKGHVSFSIGYELPDYNATEILMIGNIFGKLKLPSNFQKDIFNLMIEIKLKEKKRFQDILDEVVNFIDANADTPKQMNKIYKILKNYLLARRFPEITQYQKKIEKKIEFVSLGEKYKLNNISNGDGDFFQFQLNFDSLYEFNELVENIQKLRFDTKFNDLFAPI